MAIQNFTTYLQSYSGISELIKNHTCDEIIAHTTSMLKLTEEALRNYPMGSYSKGQTVGYYQFVIADLKKNILRYDKVYEMLADERSKEVFTHLLQYRLLPVKQFLEQAYDATYPQYFDKDIVSCTEDEVFVDCGGFIGDTAEEFIKQYQKYKHIYVYEPSDDNIETCRSNLSKYQNITVRNCGVGEKNEQLGISNCADSSNFLNGEESEDKVQIVSLDEDIQEKVSFIKMDIEGFEISGILGAKNHIKNDTPKLAICTYRIVSDMWEIPLLIHEINPNYKYYFRHYRPDENWETVVYAIPKKEAAEKKEAVRAKTAIAPCNIEGWFNFQFTKDCGLIPYLLHKNHNMDVVMLGANKGPYPYLDSYVKGLKMAFLETGSVQEKVQYIKEHAKEIDLLIIYGPFETYFAMTNVYKQLNPVGKIYLALDANSHWMDRIEWDKPKFIQFMNHCDVIATSCKAMQKHLNEKWPWKIEYIPNGYYNLGTAVKEPEFAQRENTILTVGRLGIAQKATNILLEAFAVIADRIPDWNLKLVGSIDPAFQPVMEQYFAKYPGLVSRVQFAGVISDKEQLKQEYEKAKIFALPSSFEGGTPNVIGEALTAGCVTAVTKIDAWEDAIDYGNCGKAVDINDIQGFASILLELCNSPNLAQLSHNAYEYAQRNYNMENIVARLYEMLYGGDFT